MRYIHSHSTGYSHLHIHSAFSTHCLCTSLGPSSHSIISERNMADEGYTEDQRPQTQVLHWQDLFSAALELLQECEWEWNTFEVGVRENIQIWRLVYLFIALHQVLLTTVNSAVLNQMRGIYVFCIDNGYDTSNCTNLAVHSVTNTDVFRTGSVE